VQGTEQVVGERAELRPGASRLAGIEGLRAVAATAVLTHHVWLLSVAPGADHVNEGGPVGRLATDLRFGLILFFALSGFLLYRPFAAAVLGHRPMPNVAAYARNRVLRIVPAYWVILLATAFVLQTAIVHYPFDIGALTDVGTLAANLFLVQGYRMSTALSGIGPAWSLAVEAIFYIALPVLAVVALRVARRRSRGPVLLAALLPAGLLLALGLATRLALEIKSPAPGTKWAVLLPASFPAQADLFAYGMAAAVIWVLANEGVITVSPRVRVAAASVAGLILLVVVVASDASSGAPLSDSVVGLACATLLLVCCIPGTGRRPAVRVLEAKPVVWVGLCSYSVYLWHTPVIFLLRKWGLDSDGPASLVACFFAALAATLALSALTYRLVEAPALARKRATTRAAATAPDAVAAASAAP
jgi:peptidoglycan/LPS O-acetylase OafA/YrhL